MLMYLYTCMYTYFCTLSLCEISKLRHECFSSYFPPACLILNSDFIEEVHNHITSHFSVDEHSVLRDDFRQNPTDVVVAAGEPAILECQPPRGHPEPTIYWKKDKIRIDDKEERISVKRPTFLRRPINQVVLEEEAVEFRCQVQGDPQPTVRWKKDDADLPRGRPPPIILQGPANQTLAVDGTALLKCKATGDPLPVISWLKEGFTFLGRDPRATIQEQGTLQIKNLRISDTGTYTCVATSSSGETSWSAVLDVTESGATISKNYDLNDLPGPPSKPQVTDVTKNSVTLSWQPGTPGILPASAYIIEAFSQSVSNSWQTVANHVKTTLYTVRGLRPNTIYLFMVRAINPQGLSDPSAMSDPVRTQDISPPAQGVDHRQVQKELGDILVRLHTPVVLTPTTVQVTWTVDRQPQFIQGYRVMYRQTSGLQATTTWQNLDAKVPTERSAVLVNLKKGVTYEIKVRPYFNEFQGMDSESKTVRTTEEAPSAPPQSVTVLTVGSHNSTSISVSWDPPPPDHQNGIIQEYKIWCLGNETRFHINKTVDAAIRSVIIGGLFPGIQYRVEVAASTSAGVGVKSEPQPIIIGGRNEVVITENNNSITEQITDVVKQPAFIAGIGGACWVILMGFSIWLYWRRKKRKGLSNYAVTFQRGDGGLMSNGSRPGLLNAGDPSYPWLADSWPATSLPVNNSNSGPNEIANFGRGDVLPPVPGQGDKTATMLSDGAIYSSIDFTTKTTYNSSSQITQATPYATTQILHSNSIHELAVDLPDPQWKSSIQQKTDLMGFGYSLPDQNKGNNVGEKRSSYKYIRNKRYNGKTTKNTCPPCSSNYDSDSWCPPLPVQTYLHQGMEDELEEDDDRVPTPPVRGVASSPAISFGQQSTATLTPSPREEMQPMLQAHLDELTRAYQFDIAKQTWHVQSNNQPPQPPVPPLGYMSGALISDLETDVPDDDADDEEEALEIPRPLRALEQTPGSSTDNLESSVTGSMVNGWGSASDEDRNFSSHRSSVGSSSDGSIFASGSFAQALVAAADKAGFRLDGTSLTRTGKAFTSSQRPRPTSPFSTDSNTSAALSQSQRPRPTKKHKGGRADPQPALPHRREGMTDDETLVPYSKPNFPSPGGHSSSGTASSKGSTGPRKADALRGSHQRNASDLLDIGYMGSNSQGQFTGEL
ncbi:hypothetical protein FD754_020952, partial [Muntiacus muntjak]